jgi:hypothetical protein
MEAAQGGEAEVTAYSAVWSGLTVTFAMTEIVALAKHDWDGTFTENIRKLFRIHTKVGKASFALVWASFSVWFFGHILKIWP